MLSDVITIAKDKRYMVLDPVQQEQPDQRQLAQLFSKKRVSMENEEFLYLTIVFMKFINEITVFFSWINRVLQLQLIFCCTELNA